MIELIDNKYNTPMVIVFNPEPLVITCSISSVIETIKIKLIYEPNMSLIETTSFINYIKSFNKSERYFEDLANEIYSSINFVAMPKRLCIKIYRDDNKRMDWGVTMGDLSIIKEYSL